MCLSCWVADLMDNVSMDKHSVAPGKQLTTCQQPLNQCCVVQAAVACVLVWLFTSNLASMIIDVLALHGSDQIRQIRSTAGPA